MPANARNPGYPAPSKIPRIIIRSSCCRKLGWGMMSTRLSAVCPPQSSMKMAKKSDSGQVSKARASFLPSCWRQYRHSTNIIGSRLIRKVTKPYPYKAYFVLLNSTPTPNLSFLDSSSSIMLPSKEAQSLLITYQARLQISLAPRGRKGSGSCNGRKTKDGIKGGDSLSKAKV